MPRPSKLAPCPLSCVSHECPEPEGHRGRPVSGEEKFHSLCGFCATFCWLHPMDGRGDRHPGSVEGLAPPPEAPATPQRVGPASDVAGGPRGEACRLLGGSGQTRRAGTRDCLAPPRVAWSSSGSLPRALSRCLLRDVSDAAHASQTRGPASTPECPHPSVLVFLMGTWETDPKADLEMKSPEGVVC